MNTLFDKNWMLQRLADVNDAPYGDLERRMELVRQSAVKHDLKPFTVPPLRQIDKHRSFAHTWRATTPPYDEMFSLPARMLAGGTTRGPQQEEALRRIRLDGAQSIPRRLVAPQGPLPRGPKKMALVSYLSLLTHTGHGGPTLADLELRIEAEAERREAFAEMCFGPVP